MPKIQALPTTVRKLEERATALRKLVDTSAHPSVSLVIQRSYASLRGCAELASLLEAAASHRVDTAIVASKKRATAGAAVSAVLTAQATVVAFERLLESGALLSNGHDVEVLKHLGKHTTELVLKIGAKLSGVEYVKDLAEIIEALVDVYKTGQLLKLRKQQVRMASDLLKWADATMLVALTWAFTAQQFLLAADGKGEVSDENIIDLVLARMAKSSQSWHTP